MRDLRGSNRLKIGITALTNVHTSFQGLSGAKIALLPLVRQQGVLGLLFLEFTHYCNCHRHEEQAFRCSFWLCPSCFVLGAKL